MRPAFIKRSFGRLENIGRRNRIRFAFSKLITLGTPCASDERRRMSEALILFDLHAVFRSSSAFTPLVLVGISVYVRHVKEWYIVRLKILKTARLFRTYTKLYPPDKTLW